MLSLKNLRILLILNLVAVITVNVLDICYISEFTPILKRIDKINEASMSILSIVLFVITACLAFSTLIISSIALWFEHCSGKWIFLICTVLMMTLVFYFKIHASPGIERFFDDLSMILTGMILVTAFSNSKQ